VRTFKKSISIAAIALGVLSSPAALHAQEPEPTVPSRPGLFSMLWNRSEAVEPGPRTKSITVILSAEMQLAILQTERDAYARRLDACHRLREIALETNDEKLEAQINDIERKAMETYRVRVNRIGIRTESLLSEQHETASIGARTEREAAAPAAPIESIPAPNPTSQTTGFKEVKR
jgi:hypothetical protein